MHPWKAAGPDGGFGSMVLMYLRLIGPILVREFNKIWIGN